MLSPRNLMPFRNSILNRAVFKNYSLKSQKDKTLVHVPVLLNEVIKYYKHSELKIFVDCTLGAAGHASSIIKDHPEMEIFIGIDMDNDALQMAKEQLKHLKRDDLNIHIIYGNFCNMKELIIDNVENASKYINEGVDGILMDLGMSSMQVDDFNRGFSFRGNGPLDMRMNQMNHLTAYEIINTYSEEEIGEIIFKYGEEQRWKEIARRICESREKETIKSTTQLVKIIGRYHQKSKYNSNKINSATKTFQALRIAVNNELENLEKAIPSAINMLKSGGRLGIISFHSLEDKIVKKTFNMAAGKINDNSKLKLKIDYNKFIKDMIMNDGDVDGEKNKRIARILTKSPKKPLDEINVNPRSRSAKLRFIEKL